MTPALQWEIKRTKVACSGGSSCDHGPRSSCRAGMGQLGPLQSPPWQAAQPAPERATRRHRTNKV